MDSKCSLYIEKVSACNCCFQPNANKQSCSLSNWIPIRICLAKCKNLAFYLYRYPTRCICIYNILHNLRYKNKASPFKLLKQQCLLQGLHNCSEIAPNLTHLSPHDFKCIVTILHPRKILKIFALFSLQCIVMHLFYCTAIICECLKKILGIRANLIFNLRKIK